jgi:hypothetical protein
MGKTNIIYEQNNKVQGSKRNKQIIITTITKTTINISLTSEYNQ